MRLAVVPIDLGQGAQFSAALKDGSEQRYNFAELFDGKSETSLSIAAPDRELNVLVRFAGDAAQPVKSIEYMPPPGSEGGAATVLDVMVLPEPFLETSGNAIQSFTLQTTPGKQTFAIPPMRKARLCGFASPGLPMPQASRLGTSRY